MRKPRAFSAALAERARAGVRVHVLIDWVGSSKIDESYLQEMQDAGVEFHRYNKPRRATPSRCFEQDLKQSRRISLEEWENRPWRKKLIEHASAVLSSQR